MKKGKHLEWLYAEFDEWKNNGVVSDDVIEKLNDYYDVQESTDATSSLLGYFSVIGAALVGVGLIFLIGYNWSFLLNWQRAIISFLPLLCSFLLMIRIGNKEKITVFKRELAGLLHMLAVMASMAMISQTYHVLGSLEEYLLVCSFSFLPVVYLFSATIPAIVYLLSISVWAFIESFSDGNAFAFWGYFLLVVPFFVKNIFVKENSVKLIWLSFALCVCLTSVLGVTLRGVDFNFKVFVYGLFFTAIFVIGESVEREFSQPSSHPCRVFGSFSIAVLAFALSSDLFWGLGDLLAGFVDYNAVLMASDMQISLVVFLIAVIVFYMVRSLFLLSFSGYIWSFFSIVIGFAFFLDNRISSGMYDVFFPSIVCMIYSICLGAYHLVSGITHKNLLRLNGGLFLLVLILVSRIVTVCYDPLVYGVFSIVLGGLFLLVNLFMLRRSNVKGS